MKPGRGGDERVASLLARAETLRGSADPLALEYAELADSYSRLDERLSKIIAIGDKYQAEALENSGRLRDALEQLESLRPQLREPGGPPAAGAKKEKPGARARAADPLLSRLHAAIASGSSCAAEDVASLLRRYEKTDARLEKIVTISDAYQDQLREVSSRLDFMSRTDPLTGLSNRRDMMERLNREASRFERYGTAFSIILFDIDDFKRVNDQYGHDAGDMVLRGVSAAFGKELRRTDSCSRWGGEEFLVLCPEVGAEGAKFVGEKCRNAIAASMVEAKKGEVRVTISGGVASMRADLDIDRLIRHADEALYRAKASGKNTLVSWLAPPPATAPGPSEG
jgi:diguanylate cyclase (GGDEF)-like protein